IFLMSLSTHFIFEFATSFLGTLTHSMLNRTVAKISLKKRKSDVFKFATGGFNHCFGIHTAY
ncbi:MAG: hypothetical protein P1P79_08970, partial [Lutibacter sp.]|nr:hypothetical protein [Lutibacter sp.]